MSDSVYFAWNTAHKRGRLCALWHDDCAAFRAYMGPRPEGRGVALVRDDPTQPFGPGNARWGSQRDLALAARGTKPVEVNGERMSRAEAARRLGLVRGTMSYRINRGWAPEEAATTPRRRGGGRDSRAEGATRRAVREMLEANPSEKGSVIAAKLGVTRQAISFHMRALRKAIT